MGPINGLGGPVCAKGIFKKGLDIYCGGVVERPSVAYLQHSFKPREKN